MLYSYSSFVELLLAVVYLCAKANCAMISIYVEHYSYATTQKLMHHGGKREVSVTVPFSGWH